MAFKTRDIKRGILELFGCDKYTYCVKYAQLFYKTLTRASESIIAQMGVELLQLRPKELSYSQKTKNGSKYDSDFQLFFHILKDRKMALFDLSKCAGVDISGLNLGQNKTVTREMIEQSPDLSGIIFPAIDLTGCDLTDKQLSGSDLSQVTGLRPENLFPNYSDKTWSQNYIARSYNGVKFPELDMTGVPTKYLFFKNCKGLKNGTPQARISLDFEAYLQSHKDWDTLNFASRAFSKPFTVPDDKICNFTACDLTNVTFTKGAQLRHIEKCTISLRTYKTFFKGNIGMREFMTKNKISCPELDNMVTDLRNAIHEVRPELSADKNRIWQGEREEGWDIVQIHNISQKSPEKFKGIVNQLFQAA